MTTPNAVLLTANPTSLYSVLNACKGGEIVTLEPGDYPMLRLNSKAYASPVTIHGPGAVLHGFRWYAVSNVVFEEVTVSGGFMMSACSNITFRFGSSVMEGTAGGINYIQGTNLTVDRVDFQGAGIYAQRMNGLTITNNLFRGMVVDAINYPGCTQVKISRNACWGGKPNPGSHPDFAQFWEMAGYPGDVVEVSDNYVNSSCQGQFNSPIGATVTVARNLVITPFQNAIWPTKGSHATLEDNHVSSWDHDGYAQATIIYDTTPGAVIFKGTNTIGPWTDANGHTKAGKSIPATAA